jgi:hypothetical protein
MVYHCGELREALWRCGGGRSTAGARREASPVTKWSGCAGGMVELKWGRRERGHWLTFQAAVGCSCASHNDSALDRKRQFWGVGGHKCRTRKKIYITHNFSASDGGRKMPRVMYINGYFSTDAI